MRFGIAVVGKPRNAALAQAIDEYETRAARYWPLEVHEVREERAAGLSANEIRNREGERLLAKASGARIIACSEEGRFFNSLEFAELLQSERERGRDNAFLIGGARGLSENVVENAALTLSLAPWTLAHELARLVLAEQLYRAGSIVRGEPYHK